MHVAPQGDADSLGALVPNHRIREAAYAAVRDLPSVTLLTGQSLERPELTAADIEKKQSVWWFLFLAGVVALVGEGLLANRWSRSAVPGLGQPASR